MKYFILLTCLWLCTTNTIESPSTIEIDGINYTMIPILYEEIITGSEQYDCLDCDCEECQKERKDREEKEKK